jgi:hypothetical protein
MWRNRAKLASHPPDVQAPRGAESRGRSGPNIGAVRASALVRPELLKGPRVTVDDCVPVEGMLARFSVRSEFGTFEAAGIRMLEIPMQEIHALEELEKMSKTKEFSEAAARAAASSESASDGKATEVAHRRACDERRAGGAGARRLGGVDRRASRSLRSDQRSAA